jgi:hypothetical protein
MKKIIIFTILLILATTTFSQQTKSSPALTKQDYLQKSKQQKTTGWILLSGGVALGTIGIIIALAKTDIGFLYLGDLVGGSMIIASVPFFNASARNKRKSMSLSFKNEMAPQIQKSSFVYRSISSLTLKVIL